MILIITKQKHKFCVFVTLYWLCEFVRHHGGEELFDNLWVLSAARRVRQVLQRLCENAEGTVGTLCKSTNGERIERMCANLIHDGV